MKLSASALVQVTLRPVPLGAAVSVLLLDALKVLPPALEMYRSAPTVPPSGSLAVKVTVRLPSEFCVATALLKVGARLLVAGETVTWVVARLICPLISWA